MLLFFLKERCWIYIIYCGCSHALKCQVKGQLQNLLTTRFNLTESCDETFFIVSSVCFMLCLDHSLLFLSSFLSLLLYWMSFSYVFLSVATFVSVSPFVSFCPLYMFFVLHFFLLFMLFLSLLQVHFPLFFICCSVPSKGCLSLQTEAPVWQRSDTTEMLTDRLSRCVRSCLWSLCCRSTFYLSPSDGNRGGGSSV